MSLEKIINDAWENKDQVNQNSDQNLKDAIKFTGATKFDVSSGVEDAFGKKTEKKISEFINILKGERNVK